MIADYIYYPNDVMQSYANQNKRIDLFDGEKSFAFSKLLQK